MGILFTITMGFLFTRVLGIQLTISKLNQSRFCLSLIVNSFNTSNIRF